MASLVYPATIYDWYSENTYVEYSVSYDPVTNRSTVTIDRITCQINGDSGYSTDFSVTVNVRATDSGKTASTSASGSGTTSGGTKDFYLTPATKTLTVQHSNNAGTKNVVIGGSTYNYPVYINGNPHGADGSGSVTVETGTFATYTLSVNSGTGSEITVNRTSSHHGGTGTLANGAVLYLDDVLKITFAASGGYEILTHTVNGSEFTSGNSHTVTGAVVVVTTTGMQGVVYIDNGTTNEKHLIYIDLNTEYGQFVPYIDDGTGWHLCS
jgi:hypothetical protein